MDNKQEKPKTEKKGKYVVKDGEGNIISQNMPKEFEDMIDLIFQEAKEKSKKSKNNYNSLRLVGKNRRTICADCRKSAEEG